MRRLLGVLLIITSFLFSKTVELKENEIDKNEFKQKIAFEKELEEKKKRQKKLKLEIEKLKQSLYEEQQETK